MMTWRGDVSYYLESIAVRVTWHDDVAWGCVLLSGVNSGRRDVA